MSSFDFSLYDSEDTTPAPKQAKALPEEKKNQGFDFDTYETEPVPPQEQEEEGFVKSGFRSVLQYPQALLESTAAGVFTGLSHLLGAGEVNDPEEIERIRAISEREGVPFDEEKYLQSGQNALNYFPTVRNVGREIEKATGIPLEPKTAFQKGVRFASNVTNSLGGLGKYQNSAYTIRGLETPLSNAAIGATTAATRQALIEAGIPEPIADAASLAIIKQAPGTRVSGTVTQQLENKVIPEELPKSQFETAEDLLKLTRKEPRTKSPNTFPGFPGGEPPTSGASLPSGSLRPGNITPPQDIGLRPPTTNQPTIENNVGAIFSPNRFYNSTQGGTAIKDEIMDIDQDVYRGVGELYDRSRELQEGINDIHPQLVHRIQARIARLEAIPDRSDIENRLLRSSNNILNDLATINNGQVDAYLQINNQTLVDQIQSLRHIVDYDFEHGNAKNIYRPLINDLQNAATQSAQNSGTPEAAEALSEARNAYRIWVETFDNDIVRPYRDSSNENYSKLFKESLDLDKANVLGEILDLTERGQQLSNASRREIVDKHLDKFFTNPASYRSADFDKALRELEAVITPQQAQQVRDQFNEASRAPRQPREIKGRVKAPEPSNAEKLMAKYEKIKPEEIQEKFNTRSGIKELRRDFSDTQQRKAAFERASKQKIRSILRAGDIEADFTGDQLYKFLNKEKNYELLSELIGEAETENLRLASKEIGEKQVRSEIRKKNLSKALNKVAVYKTIDTILGIF
jgi:hypothetical protein